MRYFFILALLALVTSCCPAPMASTELTTAFIATVSVQENGITLLSLANGGSLELAGLGFLSVGQRLYIQGTLEGKELKVYSVSVL